MRNKSLWQVISLIIIYDFKESFLSYSNNYTYSANLYKTLSKSNFSLYLIPSLKTDLVTMITSCISNTFLKGELSFKLNVILKLFIKIVLGVISWLVQSFISIPDYFKLFLVTLFLSTGIYVKFSMLLFSSMYLFISLTLMHKGFAPLSVTHQM